MREKHREPPPATLQASPEFVICRVAIEAFLHVTSRRKGERFLQFMADRLSTEESLALTLNMRPAPDEEQIVSARRDAMLWFRAMLPTFTSKLSG